MNSKILRLGLVLAATILMLLGSLNTALAWTLSGTIYGGSNPLPDAKVTFYNATDQSEVSSSTTDAAGKYTVSLNNGSYNLLLVPPLVSGLANSVVNGVTVNNADVTQNVVLIQTANYLTGTVKTGGGVSISKIMVQVLEQTSGTLVGEQITDSNGGYSIPISSGLFRIDIKGGPYGAGYDTSACGGYCFPNVPSPQYFGIMSISSNISVNGDTVRDLVLPLVTVSGKTTDSNGVPVPGVKITQSNHNDYGDWSYSGWTSEGSPGQIVSDSTGSYSLGILIGTDYSLTLIPPMNSGFAQTVVNNFDVPAAMTRNFVLQAALHLTGTVKTGSGVGVSKIKVQVLEQTSGTLVGEQITDSNGGYSIPISSGLFRVDIKGGPYGAGYDTAACGGYCFPNVPSPQYFGIMSISSNISVTGDTVRDLVLPLVTVSGKTTDSNGDPIPGVKITQSNHNDYGDWSYSGWTSEGSPGQIVSDSTGSYSLGILIGTDYSLTLIPPMNSGFAQTVVNNFDVPAAMTRNFALQAALHLTGTVKTGSGVSVSKIKVQVFEQTSGTLVGEQITDSNGGYSIPISSGLFRIDIKGGPYGAGYDTVACGGYCFPNVPSPQYFGIMSISSNISVTGDTVRDLVLPLVTVSGKTTDSNGVPVPGVKITQSNHNDYGDWSYSGWASEGAPGQIVSDSTGTYSLGILIGTDYSLSLIPPVNSGFAQTPINGINISKDILQNIILAMPDTKAPIILSGPKVSSSTDTTATIEWQTNEPAKGGVVYGTTNPPGTTAAESTFKTVHSLPLTGLSPNTTYYIQVSATDADHNGPTDSSVISFTTKTTPDTTAPIILTGPTVTSITHTSAVVEWTTNEPSTGSVNYGLTSTPDLTLSDAALATTHRIVVTGLTPETVHYLKTTATDAANNDPTNSPVISFRTVATPDTIAPVIIEGPMAINISDTGATIIWRSDEPATSGVSWNDGTAYGVLSDDALTIYHSVKIAGLTAATLYNFTVSSKDAAANGPTLSTPATFTTLQPADSKPPVIILQPMIRNINHQMALIYWETDEPADSIIEYGPTLALGSTEAKAELNTKHNRPLTGLLSGTTYYYRVLATDWAGNGPAASQVYTFTTDSQNHNKAPVITAAPEIVYSSEQAATVYFETDIPCDTVVNYGEGSSITMRQSDGEKVNKHQATITNLTPNTSYGVQVSCTDIAGNTVVASAGRPVTFMASSGSAAMPGTIGFMSKSLQDTTPPVITAVPMATAITPSQVTISWTTNEIANSQVIYNLNGQPLIQAAGDIVQVFSHSVVLTNLTPNTTYQFAVRSVDPSGNLMISSVYNFTTSNPANGSCGAAHATTATSQPATDLCTAGTPSIVTGSGPWSWACNGISGGTTASCSAQTQTWLLTTLFAGTGDGSIHGDLSCESGVTCPSVSFFHGTTVGLSPTANAFSIFDGWLGACTGTGNCSITVNSNKTVTAIFTAAPKAKVGSKGFTTLQAAYDDIVTTNGSVIKLLNGSLADTLTAGRGIAVKLEGGYNAAYDAISTETTIQGPVRIKAGTFRMKSINVK